MTQGILRANSSSAVPAHQRKKFVTLGVFYETTTRGADYEADQLEAFVRRHKEDPTKVETSQIVNWADKLAALLNDGGSKGDVLVVSKDFNAVPDYVRRIVRGFEIFEVYIAKSKMSEYQKLLREP